MITASNEVLSSNRDDPDLPCSPCYGVAATALCKTSFPYMFNNSYVKSLSKRDTPRNKQKFSIQLNNHHKITKTMAKTEWRFMFRKITLKNRNKKMMQ